MPGKTRIDGLQSLQVVSETNPADSSGFVLTVSVPSTASAAATRGAASTSSTADASPSTLSLYAALDTLLDAPIDGGAGNDKLKGGGGDDVRFGAHGE